MASTTPLTVSLASALKTTRSHQRDLEQLSPFELKDYLITLAKDNQQTSALTMLNAGRGNPNWIATEPRDAFFLLGRFAMKEARRVRDDVILAGMPAKKGCADRLRKFLAKHKGEEGYDFMVGVLEYGVKVKGFDPDEWIHELTDSIIGDHYPVPPRALVHLEQIVSAQGQVRPVPGRRRHRGHVLHLRFADAERLAEAGRHHRAVPADLHALYRDRASGAFPVQDRRHQCQQHARRRHP
jgi:hypothetical protein